ncbi:hypothetical protein ACFE04_026009 [Oxalis oulophora]
MGDVKKLIDHRSGFCQANSVFYSKRSPIPVSHKQSLDVTSFISSQAHHGSTAFIDASTGRQLSFSQFWKAVDSVSSSLSEMGIRKGDVILIMSPNSMSFPIVCHSVLSLGAILTTANPFNTPQELSRQFADCKPKLAFTTQQLIPKLTQCQCQCQSNLPIILLDNHHLISVSVSPPTTEATTTTTTNVNVNVVTTLTQMINTEPTQTPLIRDRVNQDDTATLLYSSGTTGFSKGVITSHRNLITLVQTFLTREQQQQQQSQGGDSLNNKKVMLCTVPMFHIYGLGCFALGLLATGTTVVILPKFDIWEMLNSVQTHCLTDLPLVPPIVVQMINCAHRINANYDLSSLQRVICGGATLSKEVIEGFLAAFPTVNIGQGYALTESTGLGASTDSVEETRRYGSVGLLAPSLEAKIVDPQTGEALTVNQKGELWLRGPSITKGYFSNLEATSTTLNSEGWLRTGDLCYFDDDGFIFIVDRIKELIKYKAFQVPPAELEALLLTHPEISDAAVIPFPDKEVGQYPMAFVVRKSGSNLPEAGVMDFIARQVAPYKKIRKVWFVESVPKTPSGKILRKDLIKLATTSSKL